MVVSAVAVATFMSANFLTIVGGISTILGGLIAIAMVVPGEHPDTEFTAARDFILKFSRK